MRTGILIFKLQINQYIINTVPFDMCERSIEFYVTVKVRMEVYLPPSFKGWGKVLFSVCLSVETSMGGGGWYHLPRSGWWGTPSPGQDEKYLLSRSGWGIPLPRLWQEVPPSRWVVVPSPPSHQNWMGYPPLGLDGSTPIRTGFGYP